MKITRWQRQRDRQLAHDLRYINWRKEARVVDCSIDEYKAIYDKALAEWRRIKSLEVVNDELVSNAGLRTSRKVWESGGNAFDVYTPVEYRTKEHRLYARVDGHYYIYRCRKDGKDFNYTDPYPVVEELFKRLYSTSFHLAFGTSEYSIRGCIPGPFYYVRAEAISQSEASLKVLNCNALDGCSQYPTAACGKLPTMRGSRRVKGTVKPSEEFPFALYLNTGHVAVLDEFDTHDWVNHKLALRVIYRDPDTLGLLQNFNPDEDETLLMRASDYTLAACMQHFFRIKESYPKGSKERDEAKLVLNAFIGMLHRKDSYKYERRPFNHLAAIIIARANNRFLQELDKIRFEDILHICVDGVIYKGHYNLGTKQRALGAFELECENAQIVIKGINQYVIRVNDKMFKIAHQALTHYNSSTVGLVPIAEDSDYEFRDLFKMIRASVDEDYAENADYKEGDV